MSFTNQPKNSNTFTNQAKAGVLSNLWDSENLPWSPDTDLPWQDETLTSKTKTEFTNQTKNTNTFTNQPKN